MNLRYDFVLSKSFLIMNDIAKKTIDYSVRNVSKEDHSQNEQTPHFSKERDSKLNTRRKMLSTISFRERTKTALKIKRVKDL